MAACAWHLATQPSPDADGDGLADSDKKQLADECHTYLDRVAKWEAFVLDARIGMRVQTGVSSLAWLMKRKGWKQA